MRISLVRRRGLTFSIIFFGVVLVSGSIRAENAESMIRALAARTLAVRTIEGNLTTDLSISKPKKKHETLNIQGKLHAEAPDHFRLDMHAKVNDPDRAEPMTFTTQVILDGKTLWLNVTNSQGKTSFLGTFDFTKLKMEFPKLLSGTGGGQSFNPAEGLNELDLSQVKYLGRVNLSGKSLLIFEGPLNRTIPFSVFQLGGGTAHPSKVRVWVGEKDGLTYQTWFFNRAGKKSGTITFSNVRLNGPVNSSLFQFTPPENTTPIDMTPMLEDELHGKPSSAPKP